MLNQDQVCIVTGGGKGVGKGIAKVLAAEGANILHVELLKAAPNVRPRKEANAGCRYIVPDFLVEMTNGQKRLVEVSRLIG